MSSRLLLAGIAFAAALELAVAAGRVFSGKGLQTGSPGMNRYTDKTPDQVVALPRPYAGAPPLIPHSIEGLAIKRGGNDCLGCHLEGTEVAEGHKATKVPPSHFSNPYTSETRADRPVGMRYNCLQCHVPQADAAIVASAAAALRTR